MIEKMFLKEQMIRLETNYGKERFRITQQMFDLWYETFKGCSSDGFKASVDEYMLNSEFPPTMASVMKIYERKNESREKLFALLKAKYLWVTRWYDEAPNKDTFNMFKAYVLSYPASERESVARDFANKAIAYWNDNSVTDKELTLRKYIEGLKK